MQKGMEPVWYWVEQPLQTGWWMGIAWVESNQLSAISTEKYTSFRILKQIHITCPESIIGHMPFCPQYPNILTMVLYAHCDMTDLYDKANRENHDNMCKHAGIPHVHTNK